MIPKPVKAGDGIGQDVDRYALGVPAGPDLDRQAAIAAVTGLQPCLANRIARWRQSHANLRQSLRLCRCGQHRKQQKGYEFKYGGG